MNVLSIVLNTPTTYGILLHLNGDSQGRHHGVTIGGGGQGPFEVDSFHAPPIGIMLNVEKFVETDRPCSPPPGAAAHGDSIFYLKEISIEQHEGGRYSAEVFLISQQPRRILVGNNFF